MQLRLTRRMKFFVLLVTSVLAVLYGARSLTPAHAAGQAEVAAVVERLSTVEGSDFPAKVFADNSFWYQQLPDNAPLDSASDSKVSMLRSVGVNAYGNKTKNLPGLMLNYDSYAPPLITSTSADPVANISFDNCQGKSYGDTGLIAQHMTGLRIPTTAVPAVGTDAEMTLYDKSSDTYTDFWVANKKGPSQWTTCWGGTIKNAKQSNGIFPSPWGSSASGLALAGGTIRAKELADSIACDCLKINHVVGIALPYEALSAKISKPANRSDGGGNPGGLEEGQYLRLPANLDLNSLNLNPAIKAVARAMQAYGAIIWDKAGVISWRAEAPSAMGFNPYPTLFDGAATWNASWGEGGTGAYQPFPFDKLQALKADYLVPGGASSSAAQNSGKGKGTVTVPKYVPPEVPLPQASNPYGGEEDIINVPFKGLIEDSGSVKPWGWWVTSGGLFVPSSTVGVNLDTSGSETETGDDSGDAGGGVGDRGTTGGSSGSGGSGSGGGEPSAAPTDATSSGTSPPADGGGDSGDPLDDFDSTQEPVPAN